jgi:acetyltransferase-like isoleucine patch superfamily enzyme
MHCKYVAGSGALLQWALQFWAEAEPQLELIPVEIRQDQHYFFDLSIFDSLRPPADATAFVAWNNQFLNFRRWELMGATIGENTVIGAGAIVGAGCQIGINARVGQGALLGAGARLGNSSWVADGVQVGAGVTVGANSTLGLGVIVSDGIAIGRQSILDQPGRRTTPLADKTYCLARLEREVRIVNYSR